MRKAAFGESLLAGVVIVIIAMLLDRISRGLATDTNRAQPDDAGILKRHGHLLFAVALVPIVLGLAQLLPVLNVYPKELTFFPAKHIDELVSWFVVNLKDSIDRKSVV